MVAILKITNEASAVVFMSPLFPAPHFPLEFLFSHQYISGVPQSKLLLEQHWVQKILSSQCHKSNLWSLHNLAMLFREVCKERLSFSSAKIVAAIGSRGIRQDYAADSLLAAPKQSASPCTKMAAPPGPSSWCPAFLS